MNYRGLTLDPFQSEAIAALEAGQTVLVCAPTGTGKTIIADWLVETVLNRGREVVYTAPIKALSNQKFRDYCRLHTEEKVGLVTGDLVIRRDAPCRVMTTEILRNMLLVGETLPELDAVVIDEIHFLDDKERGTTWEELLIYLPKRVQVLGLSATLSNARQFAAWLEHVRGTKVKVIREDKRTVPLQLHIANIDEGLVTPQQFDAAHKRWERKVKEARRGSGREDRRHGGQQQRGNRRERFGPSTSHTDVFDILSHKDLLPYLYFSFSRKSTEQCARNLGRRVRKSLLNAHEQTESDRKLAEFAATDTGRVLEPELREIYSKGIAFHHAGLHVQLKALVEELYEHRLIKVLYCTSTFALGINMPARTAVFDALKKFDGTVTRPLRTREFLQKAGRAGRRGMDKIGHVVIRTDHEDWRDIAPLLGQYNAGEPEPVRSSFSLSFHSVVNLVAHNPIDHVREVIDKSFLAFVRGQDAQELHRRAGDRDDKEAQKMRLRAQSKEDACWIEFQRKVQFLQRIGYLGQDMSLGAGAEILRKVQIEEIFVTELILSGVVEDVAPARLFGLLCAVNKEFGRDTKTNLRLRHEDLELAKAADSIRNAAVVRESEAVSGVEVTWCPEMIPYGRAWAEGRSLAALLEQLESGSDISGDLVGAFRRAKDLAGQVMDVYSSDPARAAELRELIRAVSRDEVLVVD